MKKSHYLLVGIIVLIILAIFAFNVRNIDTKIDPLKQSETMYPQ